MKKNKQTSLSSFFAITTADQNQTLMKEVIEALND